MKKIQQEFDNYASRYDLTDAKIELKYIHTGKVAKNSLQIAKSLGLSEDDQNLSWEIGIFHDSPLVTIEN